MRAMLGGKPAEKSAEVPAEKSESGRDSGTGKPEGKQARGEDGKFQTSQTDAGDDKKPAEGEDGPQKRINKAVKAQREAERKLEQLQREIEDLKKGGDKKPAEGKKDEKPKADPGEPKKPKQEDFTTYEDYIEALTDYKADLREFQRDKKDKERKQAEANESFKKTWEKKKDAAREKFPDFDDVMEDAGETPISRVMHNIINESDIGPQLAYYLATHPEQAADIKGMSTYAATRAMGRIEDKLSAEPEKPAEDKKPKAEKKELPKPARTVGGNASPKEPKIDDPDIDMGTFKRLAKAHLNRER